MRGRLSLHVVLVLVGLWTGSLNAGAQDPFEREVAILEGEEPVLMALPLVDAPGATTVITAEEIERSGAPNIFELLRRVPGVDIRYTAMGGHIGIRSSGTSPFSEQVLLLIDGSPYNSPDKGGFPGHPNYVGFFPLDRIARIEIVKGPVSVLHGANAFGGVINIVSKQAVDVVQDRVEGNAYGVTILAGERNTFQRSGRASIVRDDWNGTLQAGIDDGDTPIVGNGDADHSRSHVYASGRRGNLWGSVLHQESRHGSISFDGVPTQVAENNVDIADVHYDRRLGATVLRASATVNRYRGTTCAECHNSQTGPPDDAYTNDVGAERETDRRLRVAVRADRTLTDSQDLTYGFEAAHDSVERRIVKLPDAPSSRDSGGVYVQHQWHLARRSVHLLTGIRLDSAEGLGRAASPRVAVVAQPGEDLVVHASWSRAYRAPTWNDRYRRQRFLPFEIGPNTILVFQGYPELERERNDSAQLGASWRALPDLVVKLDLYDNRVRDSIELGPGTFVPGQVGEPDEVRLVYRNRDETYSSRGGELTILARPVKSLNVMLGYTHRDLSLADDDPLATYAPGNALVLTTAWSPTRRWTFDLGATYQGSYSASDEGNVIVEPSFTLFDAAIHYAIPVGKGRLLLGLLGRNVTDQHPAQSGADLTQLRGRTLALEARWDF